MREFSVDMIPGGAQTAVACNQFESGDTWVFALYYDGGRYSIPADAEVSITGTKPDGAAYNIAGTVVNNAVQIVVTDQITACAGRSIAEILVESETDGTTLYSANFPLLVEPAAVQGEFSPSEIPSAIVDTDGNVYYSAEYIPEVSGGVPTEVRQAMKTLFSKAAYIETGLADEVAVITAWAEATTAITVSPSTASVSSTSTTAQLSAVTTPAGGAVTWASSSPTVATVSSAGLVTAVGNGTCTITATSGNVSASCAVTVTGFATLTGIDATYTQSGTVYDTASLDDLKDDLVVTASYDDSSTETITDYTLSGTLAAGTSTITVSYGGFTDTFSVTVTHYEAALYAWDLTDSLTDTEQSVTATTTATFTEDTGLVFANINKYADFGAVYGRDRTYILDVASMGAGANNSHRRIIAFDTDANTGSGGAALVYRHGYGWRFFTGSTWDGTELSGQDDELLFSGKTVKLYLDEDGYAHVSYKTTGADDSTYVSFGTSTSPLADFTGGHVYIGGSTNDSVANATFTGFTIWEGEK